MKRILLPNHYYKVIDHDYNNTGARKEYYRRAMIELGGVSNISMEYGGPEYETVELDANIIDTIVLHEY